MPNDLLRLEDAGDADSQMAVSEDGDQNEFALAIPEAPQFGQVPHDAIVPFVPRDSPAELKIIDDFFQMNDVHPSDYNRAINITNENRHQIFNFLIQNFICQMLPYSLSKPTVLIGDYLFNVSKNKRSRFRRKKSVPKKTYQDMIITRLNTRS